MKSIEAIYEITAGFPKNEIYNLTSQMRRSAVSVASNIAEGCARKGNQEKIQFFIISRGSLSELDAQLEISFRLGLIDKEKYCDINNKIEEISRMLQGLIDSRNNSLNRLIT